MAEVIGLGVNANGQPNNEDVVRKGSHVCRRRWSRGMPYIVECVAVVHHASETCRAKHRVGTYLDIHAYLACMRTALYYQSKSTDQRWIK